MHIYTYVCVYVFARNVECPSPGLKWIRLDYIIPLCFFFFTYRFPCLSPGLAVTEIAAPPLPGSPTNVWTVKRAATEEHDAYIVVSFLNATLVLSIGETVEGREDRRVSLSLFSSSSSSSSSKKKTSYMCCIYNRHMRIRRSIDCCRIEQRFPALPPASSTPFPLFRSRF